MKKKFLISFISAILLVVIGLAIFFISSPKENEENKIYTAIRNAEVPDYLKDIFYKCEYERAPGACYYNEIEEIIGDEGVAAGINQLNGLLGYSRYNYIHFAFHVLGHYAYYDSEGDMATALSYLPEGSFSEDKYSEHNGYVHGLFQSFFEENHDKYTRVELMDQVCGEDALIQSKSFIAKNDCYHGVGHALMYINNNNLGNALGDCDQAPDSFSQQICYYGVFMEVPYLYVSYYHPEEFDIEGEITLADFCNSTEERYKSQCSYFVGTAYLVQNPANFAGAFDFCHELDEKQYVRSCVGGIAYIQIPTSFGTDIVAMEEACNMEDPELEDFCREQLAIGMKLRLKYLRNIDVNL